VRLIDIEPDPRESEALDVATTSGEDRPEELLVQRVADFPEMRDLLGSKLVVWSKLRDFPPRNQTSPGSLRGALRFLKAYVWTPWIHTKSKQRLLDHTSERRDADIPLAQAPKPQVEIPAFVRIE